MSVTQGKPGSISAMVINVLGWLFGAIMVAWSGYRSWHILYNTVSNDNSILKVVIPLLGICIFEGGMLYWFFHFVHKAEGTPQKAVAIVTAILDLIFVLIAFGSDVANASGASELDKSVPVVLVGAATAVNLIAKIADYLTSPKVLVSIKIGGHTDTITDMAMIKLEQSIVKLAEEKAEQLAAQLRAEVMKNAERMVTAQSSKNGKEPAPVVRGNSKDGGKDGGASPQDNRPN